MIDVEMGEKEEVDLIAVGAAEVASSVTGDPLAGALRSIGLGGHHVLRRGADGAGIDHQRCAVGKKNEGAVAAAGGDLVNVEHAGLPGGEDVR